MTETEKQEFWQKILTRANEGGFFTDRAGVICDALNDRFGEGHFTADSFQCNPFGMVHGGVYYTLMDHMAGMVVAANGVAGVTIDSNLSYIHAARLGEAVKCRVERVHLGRSVGVMEAKCFGEDGTLLCTGIFHLFIRGTVDSMMRVHYADEP